MGSLAGAPVARRFEAANAACGGLRPPPAGRTAAGPPSLSAGPSISDAAPHQRNRSSTSSLLVDHAASDLGADILGATDRQRRQRATIHVLDSDGHGERCGAQGAADAGLVIDTQQGIADRVEILDRTACELAQPSWQLTCV